MMSTSKEQRKPQGGRREKMMVIREIRMRYEVETLTGKAIHAVICDFYTVKDWADKAHDAGYKIIGFDDRLREEHERMELDEGWTQIKTRKASESNAETAPRKESTPEKVAPEKVAPEKKSENGMSYELAVRLIGAQTRNIRKVNGVRFVRDGYEYRVKYFGGFAAYVGIDRREIGRRKFQYFGGVGASSCWTVGQVMEMVMEEVEKKNGRSAK